LASCASEKKNDGGSTGVVPVSDLSSSVVVAEAVVAVLAVVSDDRVRFDRVDGGQGSVRAHASKGADVSGGCR